MVFDTLDQLEMYIPVLPSIRLIADIMDHDDLYSLPCGTYKTKDEKVSYTITEYMTSAADRPFEYHTNCSILMIVLKGQELLSTSWREMKKESLSFDREKGLGFVQGEPISVLQATQGRFVVFFPGEPYKSGVAMGESAPVKKVVFKVEE